MCRQRQRFCSLKIRSQSCDGIPLKPLLELAMYKMLYNQIVNVSDLRLIRSLVKQKQAQFSSSQWDIGSYISKAFAIKTIISSC